MTLENTKIVLVNRPEEAIDPEVHSGKGTFLLKKEPVKAPGENEFVAKTLYLSVDPAMRGWLRLARSYIAPVKIDEVMRSAGISQVVQVGKGVSDVKVGDLINGYPGWQQYATFRSRKDDYQILSELPSNISPSVYLGALGAPGLTAYFGLTSVGKIKPGETVVISGAAGAVGLTAAQIAKAHGCKVIGIAGGKEKCAFVKKEYGIDDVLDYKDKDFRANFIKSVGYLDVYFDNVGGEILNLALTRMKKNARIICCGAISDYNNPNPKGPRAYMNIISQRATVQGFIVFDYADQYSKAQEVLLEYVKQNKLKVKETTLAGLENAPKALVGLFEGANTGKMIVDTSGTVRESKL